MKKYLTTLLAAIFCLAISAFAQEPEKEDTIPVPRIFLEMPDNVEIIQPDAVKNNFATHVGVASGRSGKADSYGIRIYASSGRTARDESAVAMAKCHKLFPEEEGLVRSYKAPYFMVTVGKYWNRAEAEKALKEIKEAFPRAMIIHK